MTDTNTRPPLIVDPQEFAEIIRVTRRTVYRYIDAGTISAVKVGRLWKINLQNAMAELGLI